MAKLMAHEVVESWAPAISVCSSPPTADNHALSVGPAVDPDGSAQSAAPVALAQSIAPAEVVQSIAPIGPVQSIARQLANGPEPTGEMPPEIARYLRESTAEATRRAYLGDVADFVRWGGRLPCDPMTLARYVAERAGLHRPSTVARRVVGISRAHVAHGLPDPSKHPLVRAVLRGVRREHGAGQRRAAPLLLQDLVQLASQPTGDLRAVRDRALLLLGFAGGFRRSELVQLDVADLKFVTDGMQVRLRRSKTDQEGAGRTVGVPFGRTAACPVLAVQGWLVAACIADGAVFRSMAGKCVAPRRMSDQAVSIVVKCYAARLGFEPAAYSGHSLRAGFVTSAAQAGVGFLLIQQQTGHRSVSMLNRYLRVSNLFEGNAAGALL